jgi:ubiquinone/menaquinone biosynthesis C-methylase UbiE
MTLHDESQDLVRNIEVCSQPDLWLDWFAEAEAAIDAQWTKTIWPRIRGADFTTTVEIGPGAGRNSERLKDVASTLYLVDLNEYALARCRARFEAYRGPCDLRYVKTDGMSLPGIPDGSVTFVYSWDSMVHCDKTVMERYMKEFARVMKPGAKGFIHHANYGAREIVLDMGRAPHFRSNMSKHEFVRQATRHGLHVSRQDLLDWVEETSLDCISHFTKPAR